MEEVRSGSPVDLEVLDELAKDGVGDMGGRWDRCDEEEAADWEEVWKERCCFMLC